MKYRNDVKFYSENGIIKSIAAFPIFIAEKSGLAYEVLRIKKSLPLFIDEHLQRLKQSVIINSDYSIDVTRIKDYIEDIITSNNIYEGNLKIAVIIENNLFTSYLYFIPHRYPTANQIDKGVSLITQKSIRKKPTAKISDWEIRGAANTLIDNNNVYETILVNDKGEITEGSRSNIFFINNDMLFTAKDELVLSGITRQKVIESAHNLNIKVNYKNIKYSDIVKYNACFISGSSPGVLQVKDIDNISFVNNNDIYVKIKEMYEKMSGMN